MAPAREEDDLERTRALLARGFGRLDPVALGVAMGTVAGLGLAFATAVLLLQGGPLLGLHLRRLAYFFPGYRVSWAGVAIGLVEGALLGAVVGAGLALAWNAYHAFFVRVALARERARAERFELEQL